MADTPTSTERAEALLFNAITAHPAARPLLFSSRVRVTERVWPLLERAVARQVRINKRRRCRWERRNKRAVGEGET